MCTECKTVKAEMVGRIRQDVVLIFCKNSFAIFLLIYIFIFYNYFACNMLMAGSVNSNKKARHVFN